MADSQPRVSAVVAIGRDRVLGKDNKLIWHIPEDLKRFRNITRGHPVIMGRKTFESILEVLGRPLPERPNIVITRDPGYQPSYKGMPIVEDMIVVSSVEEAIENAKDLDTEEVFVIGGGQIFEAMLPVIDKLYLTLIEDDKEGDSFFPEYEKEFTKKTFEESHEWERIKYTWVDLER